jgi:hypothetical protein
MVMMYNLVDDGVGLPFSRRQQIAPTRMSVE